MYSIAGSRGLQHVLVLASGLLLVACGDDPARDAGGNDHLRALFVAHEGSLVSYDLDSGEELAGEVQDVAGPTDMQALDDGRVILNLTSRNEVLVVDGTTMLEIARIPSSGDSGTSPVHGFLTPIRDGKQYYMSLNDGEDTAATNSASFIDVVADSDTVHTLVGETPLGIGHHKASFSTTLERVVISNIADCDDVLTVYDYSDPANIVALATLTPEDAGWDGSSFETTCDATYQMGLPPAPHGCATSALSGKAYCNITSSGAITVIDIDADPPTFEFIETSGSGGGYTRTSPGGDYVYSLQAEPREGSERNPGEPCQIGQLAVINAANDMLVGEIPLFYDGPGCARELVGTDEETSEPAHIVIHEHSMFVTLAGGFMVDDARVRRQLVLDLTDPAHPTQLFALEVGVSTSYHGDTLSGDGERFFVANNLEGTVTEIDCHSHEVLRTLTVRDRPMVLATWAEDEGPSHQTGPIE